MIQRFIAVLLLLAIQVAPAAAGEPDRPFKIVQVSDTHIGRQAPAQDGARVRAFLSQLLAQESPVDLWAFTGDLTHKGLPAQFEAFRDALDVLPKRAKVVLVKGNHDEGKPDVKGEAFEQYLGDPTRSFKLRGHRIIVAPKLTDEGEDGTWLKKTLRRARLPALLFVHYYPRSKWLNALRSTSLRAVFSGHWHGNQAVRSGNVYSFNTAAATLGGWDFSPPVARVVELAEERVTSRLVPRAPRESAVAWGFKGQLLVQLVTAKRIDAEMHCSAGGQEWTLTRRGIYAWEGPLGISVSGPLRCRAGAWSAKVPLHIAGDEGVRWARPLGRMVYGGGPVIAGDLAIVVTRTGLTDDHGGAVHALGLKTGATRWSRDLAGHPAGTPAADADHVYVSTLDGTVALDLVTGEPAWTFSLADDFPPMFVSHWVGTGPALRDARLYTCYQKGPFVLDATTGKLLDQEEPIDGYDVLGVSPARLVGDRLFCGTFTEGLFSWIIDDKGLLERSWADTEVRVTAAPAPGPDARLWVRTLRGLRSYDPATGESSKEVKLDYLRVPSGPLPIGEVVVTTGRRGRPAALRRSDDSVAWTHSLKKPLATFELNRFDHPAPVATPVLAGSGVVVASPDGFLRFLDAKTGKVRGSWFLGAPLASTPAVSVPGDLVVFVDLGGTAWGVSLKVASSP